MTTGQPDVARQLAIFDSLCRIVSRQPQAFPPRIRQLVREARLFVFPGRAHETIPYDELYEGDREWLSSMFFLPFPVVAIADTASVVLLWDHVARYQQLDQQTSGGRSNRRDGAHAPRKPLYADPEEAAVIGSQQLRGFLECIPADGSNRGELGRPEVNVMSHLQTSGMQQGYSDIESGGIQGSCLLTWGIVNTFQLEDDRTKRFSILGTVEGSVYATPTGIIDRAGDGYSLNDVTRETLRNVSTAYEEVAFNNTPNRWVVETRKLRATAAAEKSAAKLDTFIPGASERPLYRMMTHQDAASLFPSTSTSSGPTERQGHERSAHPRTYRHPRFRHRLGQTVIIPATWVGPTEVVVGNTSHRIVVRR